MYFVFDERSGNHPITVRRKSEAVRPTVTKQMRRVK
jgi:hypothetical protein